MDKKKLEAKQKEQQTLKKIFKNHQINFEWDYDDYDHIVPGKYIIELKNRDFDYQTFINKYQGRPLIEISKYEKLIKKAKEDNLKFIYIFAFTCGKTLIINLSDDSLPTLLFQKTYNQCPNSTLDFTFTKDKLVYIIPSYLLNKNNSILKQY
jgi:hypothetical protein